MLLRPWDFLGKSTGVGVPLSLKFLERVFSGCSYGKCPQGSSTFSFPPVPLRTQGPRLKSFPSNLQPVPTPLLTNPYPEFCPALGSVLC